MIAVSSCDMLNLHHYYTMVFSLLPHTKSVGCGVFAKKCGKVFAIKKQIGIFVFLECMAVCLSGCAAAEGKIADLTVIYGVAMAIPLLLLAGCCPCPCF